MMYEKNETKIVNRIKSGTKNQINEDKKFKKQQQ